MIRSTAALVLVAALLGLAAEADAAWNPGTTSYTRTIGNARNALGAYWGQGRSAASMPARAQKALKKADRRLGKALTVLGNPTDWKKVQKSLKYVATAMYYVQKAARKASTVTAFQAVVYDASTGVGPLLYGAANGMAVSASNYVNANFTSRRSTRKLLTVGGYLAKAARLAGKTPPNFSRAIGLCRDAIRVLGRKGLL